MNTQTFDWLPMDQLQTPQAVMDAEWIWDGYLARGNITLLTSLWKSGKTTLLAGMVRAIGGGQPFLDRPCAVASVVVVSEESPSHWAERTRAIPIGPHAKLISRPFRGQPTVEQWDLLIREAEAKRQAGELDVFVVDPLASFLPGRSENVPGTILDMFQPLRRLAECGVAVLVLHHPRKQAAVEGSAARGSGALLGFVDVILELHHCGKLATDSCRRRLVGLSRRSQTPDSICYEWVVGTPEFRVVADPTLARFQDNWATVRAILETRRRPATHKELLTDWPSDRKPPAASVLYEWLGRAAKEGLVERIGNGTSGEPYRFRLPRKDDDFFGQLDRLPPLRR